MRMGRDYRSPPESGNPWYPDHVAGRIAVRHAFWLIKLVTHADR